MTPKSVEIDFIIFQFPMQLIIRRIVIVSPTHIAIQIRTSSTTTECTEGNIVVIFFMVMSECSFYTFTTVGP